MIEKILNGLERLVLLIVLVLFFQGKGAHGVFIAIAAATPVLRAIFSEDYRRSRKRRWESYVDSLRKQPSLFSAFVVVGLPFLTLTLANGVSISSYDNFGTQLTAASVVTDGNLEIGEFRPETSHNPYFFTHTGTGYRSAYPIGMVVPMFPIFLVARLVGADLSAGLAQWRLAKWTAAWLAAISLSLFFLIAYAWSTFEAAGYVTAFLGLGSVFTTTLSQGVWTHSGVVLSFLAVLWIVEKYPKSPFSDVLLGFCLAEMFACRLSSAILIAPLLLWVRARRGWKSMVLAGTCAIAFHLPLTIYYASTYGTPLGPQMQMGQNMWKLEAPFQALAGLLFSPGRGLFIYQPWLLLLALFPLSGKIAKVPTGLLGSVAVLHLALIATWPAWTGGTCWGSRLLSEMVIPLAFLALPVVQWLMLRGKNAEISLRCFILIGFLFHLPHLFLRAGFWDGDLQSGNTELERMWNWSRPPFLYPFQKK